MCGWRPQQRLSSGAFELVAQPRIREVSGQVRLGYDLGYDLGYVLPVSAGDTTIHTTSFETRYDLSLPR